MTAVAGTRARVLEVARAEIGYAESPAGSNRTKYGKAYGMDGQPWCAIWVWWVFQKTGVELPMKTAYTPALAYAFQRDDRWLSNTSKSVQPGDVVLFYWRSMGRIAHTGIVEKVLSDGNLQTIEGNTESGGGRTGGRVMRQIRSRATVHPNGGFGVPAYEEGWLMALNDKQQKELYDKTLENNELLRGLKTGLFSSNKKAVKAATGRGGGVLDTIEDARNYAKKAADNTATPKKVGS